MPVNSNDVEQIEENWNNIRRQLRSRWPELSADDVKMIDGDSQKLIALVHQRTGGNLPEIRDAIDEISQQSGGLLSRVAQGVSDATNTVSQQVGDAYQYASDATSTQYGNLTSNLSDTIRKSPSQTMAVAFGLGIAIGLLALPTSRPSQSRWQSWY